RSPKAFRLPARNRLIRIYLQAILKIKYNISNNLLPHYGLRIGYFHLEKNIRAFSSVGLFWAIPICNRDLNRLSLKLFTIYGNRKFGNGVITFLLGYDLVGVAVGDTGFSVYVLKATGRRRIVAEHPETGNTW